VIHFVVKRPPSEPTIIDQKDVKQGGKGGSDSSREGEKKKNSNSLPGWPPAMGGYGAICSRGGRKWDLSDLNHTRLC